MNREIPVHNPGKNVLYVGGNAIPPRETRILPADLVPVHLLAPETPAEPGIDAPDDDAALRELLGGTVAEVRASLDPLSDEHLVQLAELEAKDHGGAGRKGVLEAIAEEQITRASRSHLAEFQDSLQALDEEALLVLLDEHGNDLDKADLVQAALDALNPGEGDGEPATD